MNLPKIVTETNAGENSLGSGTTTRMALKAIARVALTKAVAVTENATAAASRGESINLRAVERKE